MALAKHFCDTARPRFLHFAHRWDASNSRLPSVSSNFSYWAKALAFKALPNHC